MKFLIMTALEGHERQEVKKFLSNVTVTFHPVTQTDYYIGTFISDKKPYEVILGRTDQTNVNAGIETERAITLFKPNILIFIGVAGGLKDVKLGDVVVGKDVYGYEKGKSGTSFLPRPSFGFSDYKLERLASLYSHSDEWQHIANNIHHDKFEGKPDVFVGTIAAGEKVDASETSELHKFLKINCSHALAIEMEGLGFLEVSRHHTEIKALLIRGISDLVENKSQSDLSGSQTYASQNAAKFCFGLMDCLIKKDLKRSLLLSDNDKQLFIKEVRKLYPEGLRDQSIWERSGGDLSKITLYGMNGNTQWFEAFKLIEKGGANKLTYHSLIHEMLEDFPDSENLNSIYKVLKSV